MTDVGLETQSSADGRTTALAPTPASQRTLAAIWITVAAALAGTMTVRLVEHADWGWWLPIAVMGGVVVADLVSGVVHWTADTWGRSDLPLIGPRFLLPFRVHHLNPDDFLTRGVLDTNGDLAALSIPALGLLHLLPLDSAGSHAVATFGLAFCVAGGATNQIHQWAHMPAPPAIVRAGQRLGLVLGRRAHARHHDTPYAIGYCITTGWCNRTLDRLGAFRRLEVVISRLTGMRAREDEQDRPARSVDRTAVPHA